MFEVNLRDIYNFIGIKKDFSEWSKNNIFRCNLIEKEDYIITIKKENIFRGRPKKEYYLTKEAANHILLKNGSLKAFELMKELNTNEKEIVINKYDELLDEQIIKNLLINYFNELNIRYILEYRLHFDNLRLDMYLPELNINIEIDGEIHKYNQEKDKERDKIVKKRLKCEIIRIGECHEDDFMISLAKVTKAIYKQK